MPRCVNHPDERGQCFNDPLMSLSTLDISLIALFGFPFRSFRRCDPSLLIVHI